MDAPVMPGGDSPAPEADGSLVAEAAKSAIDIALSEPEIAEALASAGEVTLKFADNGDVVVDVDGEVSTTVLASEIDGGPAPESNAPPMAG